MNRDELIKAIVTLIVVIAGSAIIIRSCNSGETLLDYAEKNNIPVSETQQNDNIDKDDEEANR